LILIITSFNPETNAVFTKLGAIDIVVRYDKLLNEWKCLKDAEKEFKQVMGLDQDKDLVQCIIYSIPPGKILMVLFAMLCDYNMFTA
jgi:hypothetical protein